MVSVNEPPCLEHLDAEADQIDLAHELVAEAEGKVGFGESKQGTERGLARGTHHGVHPADLRVEAPDRPWVRQIYLERRADMAGAENFVPRLECLRNGGADRPRCTDD